MLHPDDAGTALRAQAGFGEVDVEDDENKWGIVWGVWDYGFQAKRQRPGTCPNRSRLQEAIRPGGRPDVCVFRPTMSPSTSVMPLPSMLGSWPKSGAVLASSVTFVTNYTNKLYGRPMGLR